MSQATAPPAPAVPVPDSGELTGPLVLFRMTSAEYAALPVCRRVQMELLDGKVVIMPKPRPRHQVFVGRMFSVLDRWVIAHGLGRAFLDVDVTLTADWTPAPDVSFVKSAYLGRVTDAGIAGPADLAVEVLSPSHPETDLETKFAGYARGGIPWYWIVDLDSRTLDEYELVSGAYVNRGTAPFDRPFAPRLFPGLTIDLAALAS
jgi:Uma2 family endonuclease